jgi:surfeit locus 1 family protein
VVLAPNNTPKSERSHAHAQGTPWSAIVATTLALALLIGLGTWQLQRRAWKEDLLVAINARGTLQPIMIDAATALQCAPDTGLLDPCAFRPVMLRGVFQHQLERHIFISVPRQANGVGGPGYWIFTPFLIDGTTASIFVNRGFVPEVRKDSATRAAGQTTGLVTLTGVLRSSEVRVRFSGANDPIKNVFYVRAPSEFLVPLGGIATSQSRRALDPSYYVDQTTLAPAGGLPMPLVGKIAISNRHLEYALTWYALAATLLGVAFFRFRRRPEPHS